MFPRPPAGDVPPDCSGHGSAPPEPATLPAPPAQRRSASGRLPFLSDLRVRALHMLPDLIAPGASRARAERAPAAPLTREMLLRGLGVGVSFGAVVALAGLSVALVQHAQQDPPAKLAGPFDLRGRPGGGRDAAPIQVALFEDPSCVDCLRAERELLPDLQRRVAEGQPLRYAVLQVSPLGAGSGNAQLAAECVWALRPAQAQGARTLLLSAAGSAGEDWLDTALLGRMARATGLKVGALTRCMADPATSARLAAGAQQFPQGEGQPSLPALYVSGHPLRVDTVALDRAIDGLLAQQRAARDASPAPASPAPARGVRP